MQGKTTEELFELILDEVRQIKEQQQLILSSSFNYKKIKDELREQGEVSDEEEKVDEDMQEVLDDLGEELGERDEHSDFDELDDDAVDASELED